MDYSNKDFTGRDLTSNEDMSGQTITASCFAQEAPDTAVFPADLNGVTFISCNLDNCIIPDGNTIQGGSQRRIMTIDGIDWLVDANNNPISELN